MSQNASQRALFEPPPPAVQPKERERVAQLIAINKSGQALDFAKDVHKRCRDADSEALLLEAYGARVKSLLERKLDRDAAALIELVRERYPSAGEWLGQWTAVAAARHGDLSALLAPLNDPSLPADKHAAIAATIRRDVTDLRALAECPALPTGHPLRAAAQALHTAFQAVTSGPVDDQALLLAEVPRSSPLAPWKMLIRAIGACYRRDHALCEKCLAAIEPDSAPARLAPPLRALSGRPQTLTPAAAALASQAHGDVDSLRSTLKRLDAALNGRNQPSILQEIRNAVAQCRQVEPGLLDRLKQHISVRAMLAEVNVDKVAAAMGGPSLKTAYFWRLLARALEQDKGEPMGIGNACAAWEEFRKHAVRESWFPAKGPEAAALYLHMDGLLLRLPPEALAGMRRGFERYLDAFAGYYRGQPPEIRALMPSRYDLDLYWMSPCAILERACEAEPCAENFQRWMQRTAALLPADCDRVAEHWSAALPNDAAPLLRLMQSAEKRNAFKKAFKLMERAEEIDGVHVEVRRARLRLLVSMAVRHLRENKPKLAENELRQIEALPQSRQGDRPAFVAALRFVWCLLRGAGQEAEAAYAEAVRFLGDGATVQFLFLEVERWCGRRESSLGDSPRPTVPLFAAFGRVCALGEDMGMPVELIEDMPKLIMKELSAKNLSANPGALAALGEAAIRQEHFPLAYAVAGAGLAQGSETQARFLFLRARSLPPWEEDRRAGCLAAASDLARRRHDADLLKRIAECRDQWLEWLDVDGPVGAPDADSTARVIQREMKMRAFPKTRPVDSADDGECDCPICRAERGDIPPELVGMMEQLGPEAVLQTLMEMLGGGSKKKRRRRRFLDEFDTPF